MEAEKQLKFFQSCVAAAFAERDNSLMEVLPFFIDSLKIDTWIPGPIFCMY